MSLPSYDELPKSDFGGRTAWNLFGSDDNLGMINLQTPERLKDAALLVRTGRMFSLNAPFDLISPPLAVRRGSGRHARDVMHLSSMIGYDDVLDNFYPQANSQWDSLGHVSFNGQEFYNGATEQQVVSGERNTVDYWARRGIGGRAIVLDVTAVIDDYDPGRGDAFTVAQLEAAREHANVEYREGDIILLYTGFLDWYAGLSAAAKEGLPSTLKASGVEQSEDMCRYLWNAHPSAIACDTFSVEAWPANFAPSAAPFGFLHQMLIGAFGFALGELWWLADLVADCRTDSVYEALLVSAPLNIPGGIGSTANAIALK